MEHFVPSRLSCGIVSCQWSVVSCFHLLQLTTDNWQLTLLFRCRRRWQRPGKLPAIMDPKPIGRIAADGGFEGAVHVEHDFFRRARLAIVMSPNLRADFDAPFPRCG